ncbi:MULTISPECIES: hypothetical protein [unclassified Romboutsia]|uniref:hypothetical protein n=1 Tax=unclassified Romboutsia TaxID=2626894 RepID=UPI0008233039|nr:MULTISPECIES: hypothetical protein [unclassified Romboutsia]SCI14049.1 Uncharacterised protein [uncultured Clostridium sp.]
MKKNKGKSLDECIAELEDYYEAAGMQNEFENDIDGKSNSEILNLYNSIFNSNQ